ncbi:hypothetical protein M2135_002938 [Parabacteroides sp. PF5-9]|nr:hypothetical protein [Parabacteroides sp. PF5-9]
MIGSNYLDAFPRSSASFLKSPGEIGEMNQNKPAKSVDILSKICKLSLYLIKNKQGTR